MMSMLKTLLKASHGENLCGKLEDFEEIIDYQSKKKCEEVVKIGGNDMKEAGMDE